MLHSRDAISTSTSLRVGWVQVFRAGRRVQTYTVRRFSEYVTAWERGEPTTPAVRTCLSYGDRWRLHRSLTPRPSGRIT